MPAILTSELLFVHEGQSVVAPAPIAGLPARLDALGGRWRRKSEFHVTAIAARVVDDVLGGAWRTVERVASGRSLGPIAVTRDVRRVSDPERPELRTIIVMVDCPGLSRLYDELSDELGLRLPAPPAHITLYSTDPDEGIGIVDERELAERAPPLGRTQQEALRAAMSFDAVFGP